MTTTDTTEVPEAEVPETPDTVDAGTGVYVRNCVIAVLALTILTLTAMLVQAKNQNAALADRATEQTGYATRAQERMRDMANAKAVAEDEAAANLAKYEAAKAELAELEKTSQLALDEANRKAAEAAVAPPPPPPPPAVNQASARALTTARNYLEFAPLGPDGMRRQLQYEGFESAAIEYAIDQLY